MPGFFLHVRDGGHLVRDVEGELLPGLDAARTEALELTHTLDAVVLISDRRGRELVQVLPHGSAP
ncbi:hypothetical protein IC232_27255 [Microvirga sp. BT688]|uniref:DUF6894 family protein n=1 Tax=Microvirga sp. TaxID=1873136 RepID=UPI0016853B24|nr:hypothetical protein [Microvirga sp.]MBD2750362.1 hypothetical protein [Microvirga sp.]